MSRTFILQVEGTTVFLAEVRNSRGEYLLSDTITRVPSKVSHIFVSRFCATPFRKVMERAFPTHCLARDAGLTPQQPTRLS